MSTPEASPPSQPSPEPADAGVPRWVKVILVMVGVLFVALLVSQLAGAEHGPGRHPDSTPVPASPPAAWHHA